MATSILAQCKEKRDEMKMREEDLVKQSELDKFNHYKSIYTKYVTDIICFDTVLKSKIVERVGQVMKKNGSDYGTIIFFSNDLSDDPILFGNGTRPGVWCIHDIPLSNTNASDIFTTTKYGERILTNYLQEKLGSDFRVHTQMGTSNGFSVLISCGNEPPKSQNKCVIL